MMLLNPETAMMKRLQKVLIAVISLITTDLWMYQHRCHITFLYMVVPDQLLEIINFSKNCTSMCSEWS